LGVIFYVVIGIPRVEEPFNLITSSFSSSSSSELDHSFDESDSDDYFCFFYLLFGGLAPFSTFVIIFSCFGFLSKLIDTVLPLTFYSLDYFISGFSVIFLCSVLGINTSIDESYM
jgi:hypothetical protein